MQAYMVYLVCAFYQPICYEWHWPVPPQTEAEAERRWNFCKVQLSVEKKCNDHRAYRICAKTPRRPGQPLAVLGNYASLCSGSRDYFRHPYNTKNERTNVAGKTTPIRTTSSDRSPSGRYNVAAGGPCYG